MLIFINNMAPIVLIDESRQDTYDIPTARITDLLLFLVFFIINLLILVLRYCFHILTKAFVCIFIYRRMRHMSLLTKVIIYILILIVVLMARLLISVVELVMYLV